MIIHLPDAVPARVASVDGEVVTFILRDPLHAYAFTELFDKAVTGGYAVRLSLVHYEGCADMHDQAIARKERKSRKQQLTLGDD